MEWHRVVASGLIGLAFAGCQARPDRVDPNDYEAARGETGLAPIPNNCNTLQYTFEAEADGYVNGQVSGFATYEYRSILDQITSIYLNVCGDPTDIRAITLSFFGVTRVEEGEHPVSRTAVEEGGFLFGVSDANPDRPVNCGDNPTGTVTIDDADFRQVSGSVDITSGCIDEEALDRVPRPTRFTGTFTANNIGVE